MMPPEGNVSLEECLAEFQGQIDALTKVCSALLLTYSDPRPTVLLVNLQELATVLLTQTGTQAAYTRGILQVCANVEEVVRAVQTPGGDHAVH